LSEEATMSRQAVIDLLSEAGKDEGLRRELEDALQERENRRGAFLAVASGRGFRFSAEEASQVLGGAHPPRDGDELSDEQLDAVSGGWWLATGYLIWRGGW
jgi:predicted ribosomally synthesized peptide with nif11-like leader